MDPPSPSPMTRNKSKGPWQMACGSQASEATFVGFFYPFMSSIPIISKCCCLVSDFGANLMIFDGCRFE